MVTECYHDSLERYRKDRLVGFMYFQKLRHGRTLERLWKRLSGGSKDDLPNSVIPQDGGHGAKDKHHIIKVLNVIKACT